jgi:cyclopropane-fatty-acyl-phospholipid synthase
MTADTQSRTIIEALLRRMRAGRVTVIEAGERRVWGSGSPSATLHIHSPRFWTALLHGSRGLAESYADGLWESPDPAAVVRVCALNMEAFDELRRLAQPLRAPLRAVLGARRRNTRERSRADIAAHYDRGNEMFELMLDPTMTYSCGFFESDGSSLEDASRAKLERICRKLELRPDDHVLEVGTGWGSFTVHAASRHGCRVTTTTISRQQFDYTSRLIREHGLEDRVTLLFEDYRDLRGHYDKLVSIEMIEAVGWRDFDTFFERCSALLEPDGTMLLQAITIDERAYEVEKLSRSFIRETIFPNGCLPSLDVISRSTAGRTDMRIVTVEDITPHYVRTLRAWRENLMGAREELARRGFDERFQRLWSFYLAYCEAGFAERRIRDVQVLLAKPGFRGEASLHRVDLEQVGAAGLARRQSRRDADAVAG